MTLPGVGGEAVRAAVKFQLAVDSIVAGFGIERNEAQRIVEAFVVTVAVRDIIPFDRYSPLEMVEWYRSNTRGEPRTGAERIASERRRQVEELGWTSEHDDSHEPSELVRAAVVYALPLEVRSLPCGLGNPRSLGEWLWPWDESIKPGDRVRELTKAGALIAAEIDRIQRANG